MVILLLKNIMWLYHEKKPVFTALEISNEQNKDAGLLELRL